MRRHTSRDQCDLVGASTVDRRKADREVLSEFDTDRYVVVLGMGSIQRAELLNTSSGGIGVRVAKISHSTKVGEVIELLQFDNRRQAEIRHISETPKGYVIGLQWQPDYT